MNRRAFHLIAAFGLTAACGGEPTKTDALIELLEAGGGATGPSGPAGTPPAAPTGLTAAGGTNQAILNWTAVSGATGYRVRFASSPGVSVATSARVPTTANTFTHRGLSAGVTYYYVVTAVSGAAESAPSNEVSVTPVGAPHPPTDVAATDGNTITVTWSPVSGATSYNLYRGFSADSLSLETPSVSSPHGDDPGFDGPYWYAVTALNAQGESTKSNIVRGVRGPIGNPPATPANPIAAPFDGSVVFSWDAVFDADFYVVQVAQSPTFSGMGVITYPMVNGTSLNVPSLTNGTTYYFRVSSENSWGRSAPSVAVTAVPTAGGGLSAPTLLTANPGDGTVSLTWTMVSGATGYRIRRGITSGSYTVETMVSGGATTSRTVGALTNGTTYYFAVRATNGGQNSVDSNELSATPMVLPTPDAPTGLTVDAYASGEVTLSWTPAGTATGSETYTVYWEETDGFPSGSVMATGNPFTVTGRTDDTCYRFWVTATLGPESGPSNVVVAKPSTTAYPDPPLNVTVDPRDNLVVVDWDPVIGAVDYTVYWGDTPGFFLSALSDATTDAPPLAIYDPGGGFQNPVANGTPIYVAVMANDATGQSCESDRPSTTPAAGGVLLDEDFTGETLTTLTMPMMGPAWNVTELGGSDQVWQVSSHMTFTDPDECDGVCLQGRTNFGTLNSRIETPAISVGASDPVLTFNYYQSSAGLTALWVNDGSGWVTFASDINLGSHCQMFDGVMALQHSYSCVLVGYNTTNAVTSIQIGWAYNDSSSAQSVFIDNVKIR